MYKKCSKCHCNKEILDFYHKVNSYDGRCSYCIDCEKQTKQIKRANLTPEELVYQKALYKAAYRRRKIKHPTLEMERRKRLKLDPRWVAKNRIYQLKYRRKETTKIRLNNYLRLRRQKDLLFRIRMNLRTRLHNALRGNEKSGNTISLLGCSIIALKEYLTNRFKNGMNWDNYGEWHIDHIVPCAKFDLRHPEEQKKCFHYTNLQPLWALDNILKSDN